MKRLSQEQPPSWIWQQPQWPRFVWDAARLANELARARRAQGRLAGAARLLDPELSSDLEAQILVEDGVGTSAIEGERLDPAAVRSSVARRLGLPTAGLPRPPRAVDGLIEVLLDATRGQGQPLTLERLCRWQAALFPSGQSGIARIRVGELRGDSPMRVVSGAAGRERVHFEAPPRLRLERELDAFLGWFNDPPAALDGMMRAGIAHLWFVTLHPFEDGNGRLARAITDMALARDEGRGERLFSLSARIMQVRDRYYAILERTQRDGLDITEWLAWFLQETAAACENAEAVFAHTLAKARFWLRHRSTPTNERQRKALNRMLDAGPGGFAGGMTTRKYASLTRASRATAYRELADLLAKGCLVARGSGRSASYDINWD
jgi:Fic family protein